VTLAKNILCQQESRFRISGHLPAARLDLGYARTGRGNKRPASPTEVGHEFAQLAQRNYRNPSKAHLAPYAGYNDFISDRHRAGFGYLVCILREYLGGLYRIARSLHA